MPTPAQFRDWALPAGTQFTPSEAASLALAYFTVGLTVAVLHITDGTSPQVMIASIFLVNAVTPTLAFAAITASGGTTASGVLGGWLVSTRFGLVAAAIAPRMWASRGKRAAAAHFAFDPNVALAQRESDDLDARRVYVAASIWLCIAWWIGGVLGVIIGERLGDPQSLGLDAVFPAVLLAIIWPQLRDRAQTPIAGMAAAAALLLVEIAPGGVPVVVGACGALFAARRPPEHDEVT
jgi:predicted branched-subunit amino acid permease